MAVAQVIACMYILLLAESSIETLSTGMAFQGIEENCILSFVIPKEKMKSSCDINDKMKRRINAMEMKVNIYKQQVTELQVQLDKQRQKTTEHLENLEKKIRDNSINADTNFILERRLSLMEKDFDRLNSNFKDRLSANSIPNEKMSPLLYNDVDKSKDTLPLVVQSMVQSEVKLQLTNVTKNVESYVKDQILIYNHLFRILPESKQGSNTELMFGKKTNIENKENHLLKEIENVKTKLEGTGERLVERVTEIMKNVSFSSKDKEHSGVKSNFIKNETENETTIKEISFLNVSGVILEGGILNTSNVYDEELNYNYTNSSLKDNTSHLNEEIEEIASSRIRQHIVNRENETTGDDNVSWRENMIMDENYQNTPQKIREIFREEIQQIMISPLTEMQSLVGKHAVAMQEKFEFQEMKIDSIEKLFTGRWRSVEQSIESINLQLQSLTEGFRDSIGKLEKLKEIQIIVNDLKKNISSSVPSSTTYELQEQEKKLKKMERLVGVYQQSLEHYRNETKQETRDLRDFIIKESDKTKISSKTMKDNLTQYIHSYSEALNHTFYEKLMDVNEHIRVGEDTIVLLQIDLTTFERKLNSKTSKSERQVESMKKDLDHLKNRNRDHKRRFDNIEQSMKFFNETLTETSRSVSDLKIQVRLSVLDEWLPMDFDFDGYRTGCHGKQFVKKSNYKLAKFIGVILCSPTKYKIFLAHSLQSKFMNIGDENGMGEDHCEFVGASDATKIKLSPFQPIYGTIQGFARAHWGQEPRKDYINTAKPTPSWYECGVSIP